MKTSELFHKPMSDAETGALPPADMEALLSTIAGARPNTVISGSPIGSSFVPVVTTPSPQEGAGE